jgi:RHS repeat-associated protein
MIPPSVRRAPPESLGEAAGFSLGALAILALLLLPKEKVSWVLLLLAGEAPRPASSKVFRRQRARLGLRVTRPCHFWRLTTGVLLVCLIGNDPSFDELWIAHAECVYPANSSTDTKRITTYSYDCDRHLSQVNSPEGVINYEYDLATGRHTGTCTTNSYVQYGYDALGRLSAVTVVKRNGTNLVNPETTTYNYTAVGNRWKVTLPNGIVTEYLYDSLNRLTNMTHKLGGTNLLASYSYQLHPTGRRTNAVEVLKTEDSGTPWITNTLSWAYDQMYRLTNETSSSSSMAGNFTNSYAYDLVGNRFSKVHKVNSGTSTTTNLYNENDQLLKEVTWSGSSMAESNAYAYDANGSLLSKARTADGTTTTITYTYDLKRKLSSVSAGSSTTTFVYNDQGIRVRSTTGSSSTLYLIDANNHTGFQQILEEVTARGVTASRSYVVGDDVLGQVVGSTVSWLLYDGHGNTRQLSSTLGAVTSRYNFEAYGGRLDSSTTESSEIANNSVTSLLYCGEQFDSTLGMYNLRARYYDPSNGRFSALDSFNGNTFDPLSLHKYAYCHDDPANSIDPSGKDALTVALTLLAFAFAIATIYTAIQYGRGTRGIALVSQFLFTFGAVLGVMAACMSSVLWLALLGEVTAGILLGLAVVHYGDKLLSGKWDRWDTAEVALFVVAGMVARASFAEEPPPPLESEPMIVLQHGTSSTRAPDVARGEIDPEELDLEGLSTTPTPQNMPKEGGMSPHASKYAVRRAQDDKADPVIVNFYIPVRLLDSLRIPGEPWGGDEYTLNPELLNKYIKTGEVGTTTTKVKGPGTPVPDEN